MQIKIVPIADIIPYENNPRKNTDAVQYVKNSIKEFGFRIPMVLDAENVIVCGHTRFLAAQELGMTEVPCTYADDLTEEQIKAFRLADNKTAEMSAWDFEKLEIELQDIPDIDMSDFGFSDMIDVNDVSTEIVEGAFEDEVEEKTITQIGDLWILGNHRLICGDSTDGENVKRLMDGAKAKMLFTSPPYSDMREYNGGKDLSVSNLAKFIPTYRPYTDYQCVNLGIQRKDNDVYEYWNEYIQQARNCGYKLMAWNVWDKGMTGNIGQACAFFPLRHEFIFVFGTEFFEINLTVEKKPDSITKNPGRKTKREKDGTTSFHTSGDTSQKYKQMESVLFCHPTLGKNERDMHPATFPVGLPAEYIKAMTNRGDSVIEPFGGSGTTLIACEQLERKCFICELDTHFCDVIVKRYADLKKSDDGIYVIREGKRIAYKDINKEE